MTKADVIKSLRAHLENKISVMKSALADSSESASGDETKSEGKYDTRAIEAAYLAEAQGEQVALAEESLAIFRNFDPPHFTPEQEVALGALVEVDQEGEICFYFLAPTAGGLMTSYLGCEVTVITPESRLFQELCDKKMGETLDSPSLMVTGLE